MKLIVISKNDIASLNISRELLKLADWKKKGDFQGNPIYFTGDFFCCTINDEHLFHDHLDREFEESTGIKPDVVIFASRHKSGSDLGGLTVHTPGNFSKAELGGRPEELVPSAPLLKTSALRRMKELSRETGYVVSYEATHHGPYLETPTFYVEIGSNERYWSERTPARVIAEAILGIEAESEPVGIGVGGGHYAPRITEVAIQSKISFGHIIPTYALDCITEEVLQKAILRTPGSEYVYFHRKAMKKSQYRQLRDWFERQGLKVVRQSDLNNRE